MVCAWCIALIAVCAIALVVKVTKAQPEKGIQSKLSSSISKLSPEQRNISKTSQLNIRGMYVYAELGREEEEEEEERSEGEAISCK